MLPRSGEAKSGGEYAHATVGNPGQSSPRPVVLPRINTAPRHTSTGFIGPQLPPHMAKVPPAPHCALLLRNCVRPEGHVTLYNPMYHHV